MPYCRIADKKSGQAGMSREYGPVKVALCRAEFVDHRPDPEVARSAVPHSAVYLTVPPMAWILLPYEL